MNIRALSTVGAALTVFTTVNAPAYAALLDFQFSFVDAATGTPVSGSFRFDDSIEPIVSPDPALAGAFYQNTSPSSTITVGDEVFTGGVNSLVVANDFVNPTPPDVFDLLVFIASVPEPASVLGLLGLAMLGIKFYPKRHG